jgi:hypothetical protein
MCDLPEHVRRNRTTPHVRSSLLGGLSEAWDRGNLFSKRATSTSPHTFSDFARIACPSCLEGV